jgi:biotin-dependent carboxylase-like uncharacterized protein
MIDITQAPPYLTIQDGGRNHSRAWGVPPGGAMDSFALQAANAMVGNHPNAAALEWALGGGSIRFESDSLVALAGASVRATLSGRDVAPCTTTVARRGDELIIEQILSGRFIYLAFSGGIAVPALLGSRSTYLPGRFGGLDGRMARTADKLSLNAATLPTPAEGFHCAADLMPPYESGIVHIVPGPQHDIFGDSSWLTFTETQYRISTASDRTGYRLEGEILRSPPGVLPSEAGCPGAVQVPPDGAPIVLMADAPTIGGYPKIGVVSEADLPILAQRRPGEEVRFERVTIEHSQRALKRRNSDLHTIAQLAARSRS